MQRCQTASYRAVVISDLHIRDGEHGDDFLFDHELADLLDDVAREGMREIVLNGDTLDFVAMSEEDEHLHPDPGLGLTEAESMARLERMFDAHPVAFEALERFVCDGGRCVFLPGNHDWDLHWPNVRARLTQRLGARPSGDRVHFVLHGEAYRPHPNIRIEHGHQQIDDQNRFDRPYEPIRTDSLGGPDRLEQNLGNFLIRQVLNPVEQEFPFINNIRPINKIGWHHSRTWRLFEILSNVCRRALAHPRLWSLAFRTWMQQPLSNEPESPLMAETLADLFVDDQTRAVQRAARRVLEHEMRTQLVVMGHSHERVTFEHPCNTPFRPNRRGYLNPGAWIPCQNVEASSKPVPMDDIRAGLPYPYELALTRVLAFPDGTIEGRGEMFAAGTKWMEAP
ncbi:MAG: metallophosphoesterase [Myxococcota bacterium]